ncbi:MAG TPA: hypothetical protein ENI04_00210 [Candidatus Wildermuthbacteria bacterium]|nr:hypothetical protein [Patescibacteria group bacterium]HEA84397.1 hypothetical protein [Candidatus Wildermuthbacteria bacterium]
MAITFIQQKKRQKYFLAALSAVILITGFVLWQGFVSDVGTEGPLIKPPQEVVLRFDVLESEALNRLENPGVELTLPTETGKGNPFLK